MALSISELMGLGQGHSGDYKSGLGKTCCKSCAHGGSCTDCGGAAGKPCRCAGGLGGSTTIQDGQADLEPGDYGQQYVQTTRKGQTVFGRQQGQVSLDRRVELTRLVEEIEFLVASPGVHPRVLAQKIWTARRLLVGSGDWSWASYAVPGSRYDSKADLEARLSAVDRVLGINKANMKVAAAFSGLGDWQQPVDPVAKLASCIRAAMCRPESFCCPKGTRYVPLVSRSGEDEFEALERGLFEDPNKPPPPPPPQPPPPFPPPPPPEGKKIEFVGGGYDLVKALPQAQLIDAGPKKDTFIQVAKALPQAVVSNPTATAPRPYVAWATPVQQTPMQAIQARAIANSPQARQATQATQGVQSGGMYSGGGGGSFVMAGLGSVEALRKNIRAFRRELRRS